MLPFGLKTMRRNRNRKRNCSSQATPQDCPKQEMTLANITPGKQVKVTGFCVGISPARRAHLQAYGLVPGYWVRVLQHAPVTVVQIEHTELAMEVDLACEIQVEEAILMNIN
jgi:Fe2+ transport system protein FeoA